MILKGSSVLIAGATGGLGSEFVKALDKKGATCILLSMSPDKLEKLRGELSGKNHNVYPVDFNDMGNTQEVLDKVVAENPKIDVLINTMGIGIYKGIEDVSIEEWFHTLNVNLNSPFIVTKKLLPVMKTSEKAQIVNIGSGLGREIYWTERIAYITSKFGLRGMSLALSKDYEGSDIKFSYIALGSMLTDFGPGGIAERLKKKNEGKKYFTPDWVARKILERIEEDKLENEWVLYPSDYTHEQLSNKE